MVGSMTLLLVVIFLFFFQIRFPVVVRSSPPPPPIYRRSQSLVAAAVVAAAVVLATAAVAAPTFAPIVVVDVAVCDGTTTATSTLPPPPPPPPKTKETERGPAACASRFQGPDEAPWPTAMASEDDSESGTEAALPVCVSDLLRGALSEEKAEEEDDCRTDELEAALFQHVFDTPVIHSSSGVSEPAADAGEARFPTSASPPSASTASAPTASKGAGTTDANGASKKHVAPSMSACSTTTPGASDPGAPGRSSSSSSHTSGEAAVVCTRPPPCLPRVRMSDFAATHNLTWRNGKETHVGEGSEGVVVAVLHRESNDLLAMKRAKSGIRQRELDTVDFLHSIPHPNLLQILCVLLGDADEAIAVVTPYMNDDVRQWWRRHNGLLPLAEVSRVARDTGGALAHLHSHGLIHRDVKPCNMLVGWGPDKPIVLADFGWCRAVGEDSSGMTPGAVTAQYRAPEIHLGSSSYTCAVDVWSLGVTIMELLSGVPWPYDPHKSALACIERLLGTIDEAAWPGCAALPRWRAQRSAIDAQRTKPALPFARPRRSIPRDGQSLADQMLVLVPCQRIRMRDAVKHDFMHTRPLVAVVAPAPPPTPLEHGSMRLRPLGVEVVGSPPPPMVATGAEIGLPQVPPPVEGAATAPAGAPAAAAAAIPAAPAAPAALAALAAAAAPAAAAAEVAPTEAPPPPAAAVASATAAAAAAAPSGMAASTVAAPPPAAATKRARRPAAAAGADPAAAAAVAAAPATAVAAPPAAATEAAVGLLPAADQRSATVSPAKRRRRRGKMQVRTSVRHLWQPPLEPAAEKGTTETTFVAMARADAGVAEATGKAEANTRATTKAEEETLAGAAAETNTAAEAGAPPEAPVPQLGAGESAAAEAVAVSRKRKWPAMRLQTPGAATIQQQKPSEEPQLATKKRRPQKALMATDTPAAAGEETVCGTAPGSSGTPALVHSGSALVHSGSGQLWSVGARRCECNGYACPQRFKTHDRNDWKNKKYLCRHIAMPDSRWCQECTCKVDGCSGFAQTELGTCRQVQHVVMSLPVELQAIRAFARVLATKDPVDLSEFLRQAVGVDDLLLLTLLADVWEPTACQSLAAAFARLTTPYSALQLLKAFERAAREIGATCPSQGYAPEDVRKSHLNILSIGGACRHFGLRSLGKRLKIFRSSGANEPAAARHRTVALGLDAEALRFTGETTVLQALIDHHEAVGKKSWIKAKRAASAADVDALLKALGEFVFSRDVPWSLAWGRAAGVYHGDHLTRKLFLTLHDKDPGRWLLNASQLEQTGPDQNGYITSLPRFCKDAQRLRGMFSPVSVTRLHMWGCLLHFAFEGTKGFRKAFCDGHITLEMWQQATDIAEEAVGHTAHPQQVATVCMALLRGDTPEDMDMGHMFYSAKDRQKKQKAEA